MTIRTGSIIFMPLVFKKSIHCLREKGLKLEIDLERTVVMSKFIFIPNHSYQGPVTEHLFQI
jgi:hypothetical protein